MGHAIDFMRRFLLSLTLLGIIPMTGCGEDPTDPGSSTAVAESILAIRLQVADALASIQDAPSAAAAGTQLQPLVQRAESTRRNADALGWPEGRMPDAMMARYRPSMVDAGEKFEREYARLESHADWLRPIRPHLDRIRELIPIQAQP